MMKLITGVPGAGKTLFAMVEIEKQLKSGREVFTNIDGCSLPGIQEIPDDNDWRNLPDGSAVFYDEAHQIFRGTGRPGLSSDPIINEMDEHRHRGFDLYFITQFPTKLHHEIRSMVDQHFHLLRPIGAPMATVYEWPEATNVSDREARSLADTSSFSYPKRLYPYYKSAVEHTSKIKIPAKIKMLGVVVAAVTLFVGYRLISAGGFASINNHDLADRAGAVPSAQAEPRRPAADPVVRDIPLSGCISSQTDCRCYSLDGDPITLSDSVCRTYVDGPMPRRIVSKS